MILAKEDYWRVWWIRSGTLYSRDTVIDVNHGGLGYVVTS
jgi:hypothetical protein